ncbi:EAL domain-containing protein [Marinomonas aquimarina]|uniref:EAL domain-containing protein n=1 Tax=Marinomonas aquimarina TaxID=295068 RepID=UPI0009EE0608
MKLSTCCEGIEGAEQAKYLITNGCHLLQGFYFSPAVTLEELSEAVATAQLRYDEIELF